MTPPAPCTGCVQHTFQPQIVEEVEAWRCLWPSPPLRTAGIVGVLGLDAAEIGARVRPGFDTGKVIQIALAAEAPIADALSKGKADA